MISRYRCESSSARQWRLHRRYGSCTSSGGRGSATISRECYRGRSRCTVARDRTHQRRVTQHKHASAISVSNTSKVVLMDDTVFTSNVASTSYGGAIMATRYGKVCVRGTASFLYNSCGADGGAIQAEFDSEIELAGNVTFEGNWAIDYGGAVNVVEGSNITNTGRALFLNNSADTGGAVVVSLKCDASLVNHTLFVNNNASTNGGALFSYRARVVVSGQPAFRGNTASTGSGGGIYCVDTGHLSVEDARFVENVAVWGGAVAAQSCGGSSASHVEHRTPPTKQAASDDDDDREDSSESSDSDSDSSVPTIGPVVFRRCSFSANEAIEEGGAIYSLAGYDYIVDSNFTNNVAESSGGAVTHSGVLEEVSRCSFVGNRASNEDPAVHSLGKFKSMSDVIFDGNYKICDEDYYSSDEEAGDHCRFRIVCARCARECGSKLTDGAIVTNPSTIPMCLESPEGSTTERGSTLETLEILEGYYRASNDTDDIRECLHDDACTGGISAGSYCSTGYMGPYCAVCEPEYASGYSYTCRYCEGENKSRDVALACTVLAVLFLFVGMVISRLVAIVEPPASRAMGPWGRKAARLRVRLRKTFPLTAVKIVVVVWQIVAQYTQVSGVEYPSVYENFLEIIDVVNLDLGHILTFSCIFHTDFYDRLLIATIGPFVVMGLLGVTYFIARRRNGHSEEAMKRVKHKHISIALFITVVVYSTVSYRIFCTFVCDDIGDTSYLRVDYSLECGTVRHAAYKVYAAVMIIVYPLGVPALFAWWLYRHREALVSEDRLSKPDLRPASDLWEPYKNDKFYYEVVECVRRIALTGLAVFIAPESSAQIAVVLLLAAVFMVISEILAPFVRPLEMWLYRTGHYVVFASMFLALLLRVDVSSENMESQQVFAAVVVAAHVAMLLVVIAQGVLLFVGWAEFTEPPSGLKMAEDAAPPLSPVGVDSFRRSSDGDPEGLGEEFVDITRNAKDTFFLGEDSSTSSKSGASSMSPRSSTSTTSSHCPAVSPPRVLPSKVSLGEHARKIPFFSQGSRRTASTALSSLGVESTTGCRTTTTPPSVLWDASTPKVDGYSSGGGSRRSQRSAERLRRGFMDPRGTPLGSSKIGPKLVPRSGETAAVNDFNGSPCNETMAPSPQPSTRRALGRPRRWRSVEMTMYASGSRSTADPGHAAFKPREERFRTLDANSEPRAPPPRPTLVSTPPLRLNSAAAAGETLKTEPTESVRQIWQEYRISPTSSRENEREERVSVPEDVRASVVGARRDFVRSRKLTKYASTGGVGYGAAREHSR